MLTIKVQTSKKAAEKYMEEHLSTGGLYTEGEDTSTRQKPADGNPVKYYYDDQMRWHGSLVDKLGLDPTQPVTKEQFTVFLQNYNPVNFKQLTAKTIDGRRLYFDATFSAPKSVSIMAITMNDLALIKAHDLASQETLKEIEKSAQTRVRVNGANELRKTGNILVASVVHATSRANDPQLHSHNLVFNVTWDQVEKKFKALEASEIYQKTNYFTEIYRNKLAEKVRALGYEIEPQKHGWEIKGVSHEIRNTFSKRSKNITQLVGELESTLNRKLTNNEKSILTHKSRKKKSKSLEIKEIIQQHKNELSPGELSELNKIKNRAIIKRVSMPKAVENLLNQRKEAKLQAAYKFAKSHLFERQSVIKKDDLKMEVLKQLYGEVSFQDIDQIIAQDKEIYEGTSETIGSIHGLAKEVFINDFVNQNLNRFSEKIVPKNMNINELRDDQNQAFHQILKNKDQVQVLIGPAGTGKSFLLEKIVHVLKENQFNTIALAPTASATQNLSKDIGVSAQTLQSFLQNWEKIIESFEREKNKKNFLIVDEAGLASVDQMEHLLKISEKINTQVLLVGDTRQHKSVEAGDALRSIMTISNVQITSLNQVVRQKNEVFKKIVESARDGEIKETFNKLAELNCIKSSKTPNLEELTQITNKNEILKSLNECDLVKSYIKKTNDQKAVLIITPTRQELDQITDLIRFKSFNDYSGPVLKKEVIRSLRFTNAEKLNVKSYSVNKSDPMFLKFHARHKGLSKNTQWEVIGKDNGRLQIKNNTNEKVFSLDLKHLDPNAFDVVQKKELEIKVGDKIVIQKNDKKNKFINGDIVQVKDMQNGELILNDGRKILEDFNHLDYGYVTTSYSSQGKTCDYVLLSMSNLSGKALSSEQFYVSLSRAREGAEIFIEDREYIEAQLNRSSHRKLNTEILSPETNQKIKSELSFDLDQLKNKLSQLVNVDKFVEKKSYFERFKSQFVDFIKSFNKNRSLENLKSMSLENHAPTKVVSLQNRESISKDKKSIEIEL